MEYRPHGGQCCGYAHVYGFDRSTPEDLDRIINQHFVTTGGADNRGNMNRILEAILSERQVTARRGDGLVSPAVIEAGGWPAILADRGFRLAAIWRNSNSGRNCYQFLKLSDWSRTDDTIIPFTWTGGRVTLNVPPEVERITRGDILAVGDRVRRLEGVYQNQLGTITDVTDAGNYGVRYDTGQRQVVSRAGLRKVIEVREEDTGNGTPAPVDPTRPVEIIYDGQVFPATISRNPGGPGRIYAIPTDRITARNGVAYTAGGVVVWWDSATGLFGGGNTRTAPRLRNITVERVVAPAPAPAEPAPVLTEFFALFRNGNVRGPFPSQEAVREAYPRVLSYRRRVILSDGTVQETDGRFE